MAKWQIFALAFKGLKNSEVEGAKRREKKATAEISRGKNAFCDFFLWVFHSQQKILGTLPHTFGIPFSRKKEYLVSSHRILCSRIQFWPLGKRVCILFSESSFLMGGSKAITKWKAQSMRALFALSLLPALPKSNLRIWNDFSLPPSPPISFPFSRNHILFCESSSSDLYSKSSERIQWIFIAICSAR